MTDSNTPSPTPSKTKKDWKKWLFENVTSGALALLIVLMIRSSIVEPFKIPSGSMIPTLFIGDHIFVNKFAYGIKLPFSDWVLDEPFYLVKREPPKRGDIVVFLFPKDESLHYIKRVIGIPGDTIEVRNKVLFVNQIPVARDRLPASESENILKKLDDPKYAQNNIDVFTEHLDTANHLMMIEKNNYMGENSGPTLVPPNSLFVMGDNRDFSNDSRFWGFVPMKNVKGKAMVIWLSLWISFSDSQFFFRPDRIGTILH
ncbi:signal peptidase I [Bdellovibrionota bacterium FG-2]